MTVKPARKFPCRVEEIPTISQFIIDAFQRDADDFEPYTDFAPPFITNFQSGLVTIGNFTNPIQFTNEMKVITLRLFSNIVTLRGTMDMLENYVMNAGSSLTMLPKDFGISKVRKYINKGDVEGLDGALKILEQHIAANMEPLTAKGYTEERQTALLNLHEQITADNNAQNAKLSNRSQQANNNVNLLNDFFLNFVMKTASQGKRIYKTTNPGKVADYTIKALMRRIRHEQTNTSLAGTIKDADGKPLNKAKVQLKPITGGRTKSTTTKADGTYTLKSLQADTYNLIITASSLSKVQQVTLNTGDHLTLDLVLTGELVGG